MDGGKQTKKSGDENTLEEINRLIALQQSGEYCYDEGDLLKFLRKHADLPYGDMVNRFGYNVMHMIVRSGRQELLYSIFHAGLWNELICTRVKDGGEKNEGLDVIQLAQTRDMVRTIRLLTDSEDSMPALHDATRRGDYSGVKSLLETNSDLSHVKNGNDDYPTFYGVICGNTKILELLLKYGAHTSTNVCIRAVQYKCYEALPILINHRHHSWYGYFATVAYVVEMRNSTALSILLSKCQPRPTLPGGTIASLALVGDYGLWSMAKPYMSSSFNLQAVLVKACKGGNGDIFLDVLSNCASKYKLKSDEYGKNLIFHTLDTRKAAFLSTVIDGLQEKEMLEQCIDHKCLYSRVESVALVKRANNQSGNGEEEQREPAADREQYALIEVNRTFHDAFMSKYTRLDNNHDNNAHMCGTVLEKGVGTPHEVGLVKRYYLNRTFQKEADMTPLHYAIFHGLTPQASMLISSGAHLDARDRFGLTPAGLAAMKGSTHTLGDLESAGENLAEKVSNTYGLSLAEIARRHGDEVQVFLNSKREIIDHQGFRCFLERTAGILQGLSLASLNDLRSLGCDINKTVTDRVQEMIEVSQHFLFMKE